MKVEGSSVDHEDDHKGGKESDMMVQELMLITSSILPFYKEKLL